MNNFAKNRILNRLRKEDAIQLPENDAGEGQKEWPQWELNERINTLKEGLEADKADVHETSAKDWPDLLKTILEKKGVESLLYGPGQNYSGQLESLAKTIPDLQLIKPGDLEKGFKDKLFGADAAVTEARAGIAETGTLVLWPDPNEPRLVSLVPPIHVVLLDKRKVYNNFIEIIKKENWADSLPTNALLISGPSKTADIEFNLAWGIHGPCELIVIVVDYDK